MIVEERADGSLHVSGYVNVTGKLSRPVITSKGEKVIEVIEERAFQDAISRASNVQMTKDHDASVVLAETRASNLDLKEDKIGLHANAVITDAQTIDEGKRGLFKGWSFGMRNIVDRIEERADKLPIRHVEKFDLDHITLVVKKTPAYAATSVELRANDEMEELECRTIDDEITVVTIPKPSFDNSQFKERAKKLGVTF